MNFEHFQLGKREKKCIEMISLVCILWCYLQCFSELFSNNVLFFFSGGAQYLTDNRSFLSVSWLEWFFWFTQYVQNQSKSDLLTQFYSINGLITRCTRISQHDNFKYRSITSYEPANVHIYSISSEREKDMGWWFWIRWYDTDDDDECFMLFGQRHDTFIV